MRLLLIIFVAILFAIPLSYHFYTLITHTPLTVFAYTQDPGETEDGSGAGTGPLGPGAGGTPTNGAGYGGTNGGSSTGGVNGSGTGDGSTVPVQGGPASTMQTNSSGFIGTTASSPPSGLIGGTVSSGSYGGQNYVSFDGGHTWFEVDKGNDPTNQCSVSAPLVCPSYCHNDFIALQVGTCSNGPLMGVCEAIPCNNPPNQPPPQPASPNCSFTGGPTTLSVGQQATFTDTSTTSSPIWYSDWNASDGSPRFSQGTPALAAGNSFTWTATTPGPNLIFHTVKNNGYAVICSQPVQVNPVSTPNRPPTATINGIINNTQQPWRNLQVVQGAQSLSFRVQAQDPDGNLASGAVYYRSVSSGINDWNQIGPAQALSGSAGTFTLPASLPAGVYYVMTNVTDGDFTCTGNPRFPDSYPAGTPFSKCDPARNDFLTVKVFSSAQNECTVHLTSESTGNTVTEGTAVSAWITGTAVPDNHIRLWVEKADGTAIIPKNPFAFPYTPMQVGYDDGAHKYYFLPSSCNFLVNSCNGSLSTNAHSDLILPAGSYYFHCDIPIDYGIAPNHCSGNPFCSDLHNESYITSATSPNYVTNRFACSNNWNVCRNPNDGGDHVPLVVKTNQPTAHLDAIKNGVTLSSHGGGSGNIINAATTDTFKFAEYANAYGGGTLTDVSVYYAPKIACDNGSCAWTRVDAAYAPGTASVSNHQVPAAGWSPPAGLFYVMIAADESTGSPPIRCSGNPNYSYATQNPIQFARCDPSPSDYFSSLTNLDYLTINVTAPNVATNSYFTTNGGDVFSQDAIANPLAASSANADYVVTAGGTITNFSTRFKSSTEQWLNKGYPPAQNPGYLSKYNYQYFANLPVKHISDSPASVTISDATAPQYTCGAQCNGVYGIKGDLTITVTDQNALKNQTIVFLVKGDLNIVGTQFYPYPGNILFVVAGNIYFGPTLNSAHAMFITDNDVFTCGSTGLACPGNLNIYGGVVAYHHIYLQRSGDERNPLAESFTSDPGILLNLQNTINFGAANTRFSEQAP